jgi:hypothetical protein
MVIPAKTADIPSVHAGQLSSYHAEKTGGSSNAGVLLAQADESPPQRSMSALFAALRLPEGRLSAALVSFAKFFSLPLESAALARMRTEAGSELKPEYTAENREAFLLAAAAAEAKGVSPGGAGLASYAAALDPAALPPAAPDGRRGKKHNHGRNGETGGGNYAKQDAGENGGESTVPLFADPVRLKEQMLRSAEQNPLLNILNRLPLKNSAGSRRWIALPFDFAHEGVQYRVSLRILLSGEGCEAAVSRFALDIARAGKSERRFLFVMDVQHGESPRLRLLLRPALREQALEKLRRRLADHMGLPRERVSAGNWDEDSAFSDSRDELPHPVNEEI